jgi:phospholipid/cholesterol/gamma-HCH transport system substrate-binding protein
MKKQRLESVKLGLFVLSGLLVLIITLYFIGNNQGLFSDSFELKTRFKAVNGLLPGNNVRYSGIDVGTVESVVLLNDTVIEVTMNVETRMQNIIRRNALSYLGTDGLIGNRVVNISPGLGEAPLAQEGDILPSREEVSTESMLQTLSKTNENIAAMSEELRGTIHNINTSAQLSLLLNDVSLTANLKAALIHLHETTEKSSQFMTDASKTLELASKGQGTLATILTDTTLANQVKQAVQKIKTVEESADRLTNDLNKIVASVDKDLNQGQGSVNAVMKDTVMANRLRQSLDNVEKGTAAFNQNMEALKHNFLLRRYFKKQEKKQKQ